MVATIWAQSRPVSYGVCLGIGTNTCRPSEPDVFGTPTAPTFASSSRSHRATSSTVSKEVPGIGSRSKAMWSVMFSDWTRENQGSCEIAASCVM